MLELHGTLINALTTPSGTTKDGKPYEGKSKVQILAKRTLQNGETSVDVIDVTVTDLDPFSSHLQKSIRLPVSVYASRSQIYFSSSHTPTPAQPPSPRPSERGRSGGGE